MNRETIVRLFQELRNAFPRLEMNLKLQDPHVDLSMDIPRQAGLTFCVNLNLQGDELHLSAGALWLRWYPCTRPEVTEKYRDAVSGLLSGRYRIVEHCLGSWTVRAQLQRPAGEGWETVGTWSNPGTFVPWPKGCRVLQNG